MNPHPRATISFPAGLFRPAVRDCVSSSFCVIYRNSKREGHNGFVMVEMGEHCGRESTTVKRPGVCWRPHRVWH